MAEVLGAVWVMLGAVKSVCSCCMEVSCTSCLSQLLPFAWDRRTKVTIQSYLPVLAWNCNTKAALWSYFLSFHMELSFKVKCRSVFPECCAVLLSNGRGLGRSLSYVGRSQISLFVMLHAALVHKLPCEAFSQALAWNCRAKAALQIYFLSFCTELFFQNLLLFFQL